ncbi:DUF4760 domain-containing protein [Stenotrophomonas maltophilia]|uniref:DUF4760 domain-containing protein n=1 Tax=Stenotrophomonas maltophilia TaxID=40324 RepID=UPI0010567F83|nr:DUF4760 domain-containing protein [Stenotrophomonas maltophilia]QBL43472.1 DUF4760 domain-containing protein [Stenotrophomonas maltophilia]
MHHIYKYAARYIGLLAVLAFVSFGLGVWLTAYQTQFFKGAELLMYTAGLFSILLVRRQLWAQEQQNGRSLQQLIDDHKWKTHCSYHQHFPSVPPESVRLDAYKVAEEIGFLSAFNDRGTSISEAVKQKILEKPDAWKVFRSYLDYFEEFCGAINAGLVDEGYAFSLQGTRVVRNFTVFEPLIKHYQSGAPTAYVELTKVAVRWKVQMNVVEMQNVSAMGIGNNGTTKLNGPVAV